MKKIITILFISLACFGFSKLNNHLQKDEPEFIPASKQRSGDAAKGRSEERRVGKECA